MNITLSHHDTVEPAFADNNTLIVFATDDAYAPYCGVALASLMANVGKYDFYDIVILEENLNEENKTLLTNLTQAKPHISLRFFNLTSLILAHKDSLPTSGYIGIAAYYRFFIVNIFRNYDRALYLDCDVVIDEDIAELLHMDFADKLIAAVPDYMIIYRYTYESKVTKHIKNVLRLQNYKEYFNSGIMLFNIAKLRDMPFLENCFAILQEIKKLRWHDQDILNVFFQNKTLLISPKWNYLVDTDAFGHTTKASLAGEYDQSLPCLVTDVHDAQARTPAIIHFGGRKKPWHAMQMLFSERFWHYAALTPFYDKLIQHVVHGLPKALPRDRKKLCFYRVMAKVTCGHAKKKYQARVAFYEQGLQRTEYFLQEYTKGVVKK